jgi:hypothetical protein
MIHHQIVGVVVAERRRRFENDAARVRLVRRARRGVSARHAAKTARQPVTLGVLSTGAPQ